MHKLHGYPCDVNMEFSILLLLIRARWSLTMLA